MERWKSAGAQLLGLVYANLRHGGELDGRLAGIHRHNWSANHLRLHAARPFLEALAADDEPGLLMKGAALLHLVPGSLRSRPMGDVDVLVRRERVPAALAALERAGFSGPDAPRLEQLFRYGHAAHFRHGALATIDLHWQALHLPSDPGPMLADAARADVAGAGVLIPRAEDAVLIACTHAMTADNAAKPNVRWLADVKLLVDRPEGFDWELLLRRARDARVGPPVAAGLEVARDWTGAPVPAPVLAELRAAPVGARVLHHLTVGERSSLLGAYAQMWVANWRGARARGERPTLAGYAGHVAKRCRVAGPHELPRHFAERMAHIVRCR